MKFSAAFVWLLAGLVSVPASAAVILDTIHATATPNATRIIWPGAPSTTTPGSAALVRGGPLGMSFDTTSAFVIDQINLQLNANTPSDGGAVRVSIVADDGSGGGPGIAGKPTFTGSGATLALTNATLFGTIGDSTLTTAGATNASATMPVTGSLSVGPGEHWLVLENAAGSVTGTAKWVFDQAAFTGGTGTAGQSVFWQAGPVGDPCAGAPCTFSDAPGVTLDAPGVTLYEAMITGTAVPEPASLALLGLGLAGLGLVSRRRPV